MQKIVATAVLCISIGSPFLVFADDQMFTSSGTFDVPDGYTSLTVEINGAGGGGGCGRTSITTPGQGGFPGGDTIFDVLTAGGGQAGGGGFGGTPGSVGADGDSTGGDTNITGGSDVPHGLGGAGQAGIGGGNGGTGGYTFKSYAEGEISGSVAVTIGSGGAGCTTGNSSWWGTSGGSGTVLITWSVPSSGFTMISPEVVDSSGSVLSQFFLTENDQVFQLVLLSIALPTAFYVIQQIMIFFGVEYLDEPKRRRRR